MKLTFPRFMYSVAGASVLVKEEEKANGLFIKPPHKQGKDEKPFKYEAPKKEK